MCIGDTYGAQLTIDINSDVYPVVNGEKLKVTIASTLRLDGKAGELGFDQTGEVHVCMCILSCRISHFSFCFARPIFVLVFAVPVLLFSRVHAPDSVQPSLLDDYEYGMCGRVFQYEWKKEGRVEVYASFGGLLMLIQGEQSYLNHIDMDTRVYCLIRKAAT